LLFAERKEKKKEKKRKEKPNENSLSTNWKDAKLPNTAGEKNPLKNLVIVITAINAPKGNGSVS